MSNQKTKEQRLTDIVMAVKDLDLRGSGEDGNNAVLAFFLVDNRVSTLIDGSSSKIANMMYDAAQNYPVFAEMIKAVAAEL